MPEPLFHLLMLLVGQALHVLARLRKRSAEAPDLGAGEIVREVVWKGPERWHTASMVLLLSVVSLGGFVPQLLQSAGITAADTGMGLLLLFAGYNIDSIAKNVLTRKAPR